MISPGVARDSYAAGGGWSIAARQHLGNLVNPESTSRGLAEIVGISAEILGIVVVGIGIAARPTAPDMSTQLEARAPVLKAGQPVIWSGSEISTTR